MKRKEKEEWIKEGKLSRKLLVFYQQNVLDLTDFNTHPGGKKVIKNYIYKDVTDFLFTVYPHNKQTTLNILSKYIIGINSSFKNKPNTQANTFQTPRSKSKKKVCFSKAVNQEAKSDNRKLQVRSNAQKYEQKQNSSTTFTQTDGKKSKNRAIKTRSVSIKLISHLNIQQGSKTTQEMDFNFKNQEINQFKDSTNVPIMKVNTGEKDQKQSFM